MAGIANYLLNFVFIFSSMALFFAPFVSSFYYRNRSDIRRVKPHFNQFMEKFFVSTEARWLVFFWAATEAFIWFIIPEFLLVLVIFMRVGRKFELVVYDFLGTIVGTCAGLIWHLQDSSLSLLPYVRVPMIDQVRIWYEQHGILGLAYQPFSGVPYKIFTHVAPDFHFFILLFLVVAIIARMVRYIVIYEVAKALYPVVHPFVKRHYSILFVLAIALFTAMLLKVLRVYSV
jgi:membrane protein YqaA with SNARE-associated domain